MTTRPGLYAPLQSNQLRLFRVKRFLGEATLQLVIESFDFDQAPEYAAFSYCWGESPASRECSCNVDSSILITENLHDALMQCIPDHACYWWADQICIDQESVSDKVLQIPNMGRIFSEASKVIVWLGPADNAARLAFELMSEIRDQVHMHAYEFRKLRLWEWPSDKYRTLARQIHSLVNDDSRWTALQTLFTRPWFSRTWTLQEYILAKQAFITCGSYEMEWREVGLVIVCLQGMDRKSAVIRTFLQKHQVGDLGLWAVMCPSGRSKRFSIGDTLKMTMGRQATVPHDKIYGVLSLTKDSHLENLVIDYDLPFQTLFAHMTKRIIAEHHDTSALGLKRMIRDFELHETPLPSWTVDYRARPALSHGNWRQRDLLLRHGDDRKYLATGASTINITADHDPTLKLYGIKVGTIDRASAPSGNDQAENSPGTNIQRLGDWWQTACHAVDHSSSYPITGEPLAVAFARTRLRDYLLLEGDRADREKRHPISFSDQHPESCYLQSSKDDFKIDLYDDSTLLARDALLDATNDQRLFVDDGGYMIIAHESCIMGDEVWLTLGSDRPYILHPLTSGTYEFRGEAYVHGIMDGEYLVKRFKDSDPASDNLSDKEWLASLEHSIPFETTEILLV